jgi:hemerythrin-like metal-binding protein
MAVFLAWKENYSVGDETIDAQHKQIIDYINEMHAAAQRNVAHTAIRPLLDRMVQYTIQHFKYEEDLLQLHGYPDFIRHKALHDKMRQRTIAFRDNVLALTGSDVLSYLKEWWSCHIQDEDKKYSPYLVAMAER